MLEAGVELLEAGVELLEAGVELFEAGVELLEAGVESVDSGLVHPTSIQTKIVVDRAFMHLSFGSRKGA